MRNISSSVIKLSCCGLGSESAPTFRTDPILRPISIFPPILDQRERISVPVIAMGNIGAPDLQARRATPVFATASPLVDKLAVLTISARERARIQSILSVGIILLTSPFGLIAGTLSEMNKDLPFVLNMILCAVGAALAYVAGSQKSLAVEATLA